MSALLRMQRRTVTLACLGVLLGGGIAHRYCDALLKANDARPAPLARPLRSLPMQIGTWHGVDVPLDERVVAVAGTNDQVYRRYVESESGHVVDLYVAYAARPARMLGHRPDVCYPAHGWIPAWSRPDRVTLADGNTLDCLLTSFHREKPAPSAAVVLHYYTIEGRHVVDWTAFRGPAWRLPNLSHDPSVYVVQVQLSSVAAGLPQAEEAVTFMKRFAGEMAPEVDALLPEAPADAPASTAKP